MAGNLLINIFKKDTVEWKNKMKPTEKKLRKEKPKELLPEPKNSNLLHKTL